MSHSSQTFNLSMQLFSNTLRIFANSAKRKVFSANLLSSTTLYSFSFLFISLSPFAIMYGNSHPLLIHYKYPPTSSFRGCIPGCQASAIRGKSPLPGSGRERFSNKLGRYAEPSTTSWGEWQSQMSVSENPSAKLDDFRRWKWKIVHL